MMVAGVGRRDIVLEPDAPSLYEVHLCLESEFPIQDDASVGSVEDWRAGCEDGLEGQSGSGKEGVQDHRAAWWKASPAVAAGANWGGTTAWASITTPFTVPNPRHNHRKGKGRRNRT